MPRRLLPAILLAVSVHAAAPEVVSVDPPNWWTGHTLNPVRLLIRGKNLHSTQLNTPAGLKASNIKVSDSGTYVFADLSIPRSSRPGRKNLTLTTPDGKAPVPFELVEPLPRKDRFAGFTSNDVIYLIMPDRFANGDMANDDPPNSRGLHNRGNNRFYHGGDLRGIIEKLPYLHDLGVTAIWLNPVYDNHDRLNEGTEPYTDYHGYGAIDFYKVDEHLGDIKLLRELVDAAHAAGIKVILDQVANHTGPHHTWVKDPPSPDWFNGSLKNHIANAWQIWTLADPHSPPHLRTATLDGWFLNLLPDLDQRNPEVARYLVQNTLWWIGSTGLDGIRQDTLPYVPRAFWRDWTATIKREYPSLKIVGEVFDSDPSLVSFFQGGAKRFDGIDTGIDTLFDFPLFYPIRRAFAEGKPIREVAQMISRDHLYTQPRNLVTFLGLHDVSRFASESGATTAGMQLAWTFLSTARGTPLVYYGDELGMSGGNDPDNRRDFPGGWTTDDRNAFTSAGRTPSERQIFDHLRTLLRFRRESDALRRGAMIHLAVDEQIYAYARTTERDAVLVAINNGGNAAEIKTPVSALRLAEGTVLIDILGGLAARVVNGHVTVSLPARSSGVWRRK